MRTICVALLVCSWAIASSSHAAAAFSISDSGLLDVPESDDTNESISARYFEGAPEWVLRPPAFGPLRMWPERSTPEETWIAKHAVRIGQSTIHGAGRGVFATIDIPSLRVLSRYHGRLLTSDEFDILYDRYAPGCAEYVLAVGKGKKLKYIDSPIAETRHWTALVNDPRGTSYTSNLQFTTRGRLKTTRRIRRGEELLIDYGGEYDWSCKKRKKHGRSGAGHIEEEDSAVADLDLESMHNAWLPSPDAGDLIEEDSMYIPDR